MSEKPRTREAKKLADAHDTDIVIIGGGIAGVSTAYELLKRTSARVTLLEAEVVGGSATGHNAGLLLADTERPLRSIMDEFGLELTNRMITDLRSSWIGFVSCVTELALPVPVYAFQGVIGFKTDESLKSNLDDAKIRKEAGDPMEPLCVREDLMGSIPEEYRHLVKAVSAEDIAKTLDLTDGGYRGYWAYRHAAASNSHLLAEEMAVALLNRYGDRFFLHEHTPVKRVNAQADDVSLLTEDGHAVSARKVILCTNGFETLHIDNHAGKPIDASFHYEVRGAIGFMLAYLVDGDYTPRMRAYEGVWNFKGHPVYHGEGGEVLEEPYVYISVRPYDGKTLISIGGPQDFVDDTTVYTPLEYAFPDSAISIINDFLKNYAIPLPKKPDFMWHGLMGYTRSGLRLIGPEPKNHNVLYNLGCNGIGLLPSFLGAERIARIMNGEKLPPSVFDPKG